MNSLEDYIERRRYKALERLGTPDAACCRCGEADPLCLELHHIAGRAFADDLVVVCRNCHRKLSVAQDHDPKPTCKEPSDLERLAHFLKGMQHLFMQLAQACERFAAHLFERIGVMAAKGDGQ